MLTQSNRLLARRLLSLSMPSDVLFIFVPNKLSHLQAISSSSFSAPFDSRSNEHNVACCCARSVCSVRVVYFIYIVMKFLTKYLQHIHWMQNNVNLRQIIYGKHFVWHLFFSVIAYFECDNLLEFRCQSYHLSAVCVWLLMPFFHAYVFQE